MRKVYKTSTKVSRLEIESVPFDLLEQVKKQTYLRGVETLYDIGVVKFTPAVEGVKHTKGDPVLDKTEIIWRFEYEKLE